MLAGLRWGMREVVLVLAAIIAAAAAYAMTANTANWGTPGDYINLAGTAFGITGGTQAASTAVALLRTR